MSGVPPKDAVHEKWVMVGVNGGLFA